MQDTVSIPELGRLADDVAAEIAVGGAPARLCARLEPVLAAALRDDAFAALFANRTASFVPLHDPARGFLFHASVHAPGHRTPAHDHAEAWAVYGMYRGRTAYRLFDRTDDRAPGVATLDLVREHVAGPGETAIVLPGQVHENWNPGDGIAWNIVIRPRPLRDVRRRRFALESGAYTLI